MTQPISNKCVVLAISTIENFGWLEEDVWLSCCTARKKSAVSTKLSAGRRFFFGFWKQTVFWQWWSYDQWHIQPQPAGNYLWSSSHSLWSPSNWTSLKLLSIRQLYTAHHNISHETFCSLGSSSKLQLGHITFLTSTSLGRYTAQHFLDCLAQSADLPNGYLGMSQSAAQIWSAKLSYLVRWHFCFSASLGYGQFDRPECVYFI